MNTEKRMTIYLSDSSPEWDCGDIRFKTSFSAGNQSGAQRLGPQQLLQLPIRLAVLKSMAMPLAPRPIAFMAGHVRNLPT